MPTQLVFPPFDTKKLINDLFWKERGYGQSLAVFNVQESALEADMTVKNANPATVAKPTPLTILGITVYDPTQWKVDPKDVDVDPKSIRLNQPNVYTVKLSDKVTLRIHYSHTVMFDTRDGESALAACYDDIEAYHKARWACARTIVRFASGIPDIEVKGADEAKLRSWVNLGIIPDMTVQDFFLHNETAQLKFHGLGSAALNPAQYMDEMRTGIATATGVPTSILRGSASGRVVAAQFDTQLYESVLKSLQIKYDSPLRQFLAFLTRDKNVGLQLPDKYVIEWVPRKMDVATEAAAFRDFELGDLMSARADVVRSGGGTARDTSGSSMTQDVGTVSNLKQLNQQGA